MWFVKVDDSTYVVRKERKSLSDDYKVYLDIALQGKKGPSAKDLRMMAFMKNLYGEYPQNIRKLVSKSL